MNLKQYSLRFKIHVYFGEIAVTKKPIFFLLFLMKLCVFSITHLTIYNFILIFLSAINM